MAVMLAAAACGTPDGSAVEDDPIRAASSTVSPVADGTGSTTSPVENGTDSTVGATTAPPVDDDVPVWFGDHLAPGVCWNDTRDDAGDFDYSGVPEVVDCQEPHDNQVTGTWIADAGSYPGEDVLYEESETICNESYLDFVGVEYGDDAVEGFAVVPTEEDWSEGGRQSVCSIYLRGERVAGTLEGIGYGARPYDFPKGAPIPAQARIFSGGESEDGQRATNFELVMPPGEALEKIIEGVAEAGWEMDPPAGGSRTVVLGLSDGNADYTLTISVLDEEQPNDLTLVFYYPPPVP